MHNKLPVPDDPGASTTSAAQRYTGTSYICRKGNRESPRASGILIYGGREGRTPSLHSALRAPRRLWLSTRSALREKSCVIRYCQYRLRLQVGSNCHTANPSETKKIGHTQTYSCSLNGSDAKITRTSPRRERNRAKKTELLRRRPVDRNCSKLERLAQ